MSVVIYHNPRCTKSRLTLQLLQEKGLDCEVIEYLKTAPSKQEIKGLLAALGMSPRQLMRRNEQIYKDLLLDDEALSEDKLIAAMHEQPILIERPIVVNGDKAAIGRPPENVLAIL